MYQLSGNFGFALAEISNYYSKVNASLKLPVVFTSFLIFLALVIPADAQSKSDVSSVPFSAAPYRVGERLTFNVSFSNFISAAHVELLVAERSTFFEREGIQIRARVETSGVVNAALYAINNDYTTYVDPETGLPYRAQQILREASRRSDASSIFNQPAGLAAIPSRRSGEFPGTYDLLSAIYRLRALPLTDGSTYRFNVRADNQDYRAQLKVGGRQLIRTNVGSFNAIATEVRVLNNSTINRYRIRIYFSDDERHVPVLITAQHPAGEIRAELAGSEFVKPPGTKSDAPVPPVAISPSPEPPVGAPGGNNSGALVGLPFKIGEQLNYQVFLPGVSLPVGAASFHVRGHARYFEREGLHFTVSAQTTNAAERVFFANNQISSYADPSTLLPYRCELNLIEGRRRLNQILSLNQEAGTATTNSNKRIEIPVGTHDYATIFYAIRTFNLTPPRRNAVSILVENKPKTLFVSALKREVIQLGSQSIPAIQISLTTDDPQSDKFQLRAWISDDERRLPLRLTAATELGLVRADLVILPLTSQ